MTTEEKAKAYDEAIKKAMELWNSPRTCFDIEQLESIFPKLVESEDEKIRKEIVATIEQCHYLRPKNRDNMLSYLERQKEQNSNDIKREWWNKGYLEGRRNAHIPARELGLPSSWDFQKEQNTMEWSEEDEKIIQSLHHVMNCADAQKAVKRDGLEVEDVCDFLFNLRPQPKQEWSEEDKKHIQKAIECAYSNGYISTADFLKSLRPSCKLNELRWRKWHNGACGNDKHVPIAIVRRGCSYELASCLGIEGEEYIMLSDLEKLLKEE